MAKQKTNKLNIILASKSPRRQFLLKEMGINFKIKTKEVNESFPKKLKGKEIPLFLSEKKAAAFKKDLKPNDLLITADTVVWIGNKVLNKPKNSKEAVKMLKKLSGKTHTVYTGVCLSTALKQKSFATATKVLFKKLTTKEIEQYILYFKPYDKAGSYGAQECLPVGMNPCSKEEMTFLKQIKNLDLAKSSMVDVASLFHVPIIKKITGSYFNVMGLPLIRLHKELNKL